MFERIVATYLNRCLGKYIQDLDTENLNVGIFSGTVLLRDLKFKPEALYELDLPIEVKVGTIGKVSLDIPWNNLYAKSVRIEIEDVFLIAGPIAEREFDPQKEKRLNRAAKRKKLADLENESFFGSGPPESRNFFENLMTTIINNLQIFIRNFHLRYEDTISSPGSPLACGICLQTASVETTNNKWKPSTTPQGATTFYQLVRLESFSMYWNECCGKGALAASSLDFSPPGKWWADMRNGLESFAIAGEEFQFLVKPITAKIKVIMNKSNEARVPKLLVDFLLQDAATQISHKQYVSILAVLDSFHRLTINRKFRQFHPGVPVRNNSNLWWKYAYNAMIEQRIRPYSWNYVKKHRDDYRNYKNIFKKTLLSPNDTELKLDLQKAEDSLEIVDIVIAQEHAKIELHREEPDRIVVRMSEVDSWGGFGMMDTESSEEEWDTDISAHDGRDGNVGNTWHKQQWELEVRSKKERGLWGQLSAEERQRLFEVIGWAEGSIGSPGKPKQYIEHKFNFTLANASLSLLGDHWEPGLGQGREVLVFTLTQFLASLETRPSAGAYKISARAESLVIEGSNADQDLIPILTADTVLTGNSSPNFLAVDFEKNPLNIEADYGLAVTLESVEIAYNEHAFSEVLAFFCTDDMDSPMDVVDSIMDGAQHVAGVGFTALTQSFSSPRHYRRKAIHLSMDLKGPYFIFPEMGSMQKGGSVLVLDTGRVVVKSELQPIGFAGLEDATQMELEERLYDRLHLDFSELQLLFCDSGDEWREMRKVNESEHHLVPKMRCQVVFSNSVKPEYRQLPRHKLNVSISSIKLNLSDRKIGLFLDFLDNLPLPSKLKYPKLKESVPDSGTYSPKKSHKLTKQSKKTVGVKQKAVPSGRRRGSSSNKSKDISKGRGSITCLPSKNLDWLQKDVIWVGPSKHDLQHIKRSVVRAELVKQYRKRPDLVDVGGVGNVAKLALLEMDKSFMSSEHSDEEVAELWARTVDLPGFDDNVSPRNTITMLLRFVIGEVVVQLCRSSDRIDRPYLTLRLGRLCCDTALMEYGPAIQASLSSLQLVDKVHTGSSGEYLHIISAGGNGPQGEEVASLLYRKVRSDCPDFKSHFHSVEQSLVLDLTSLNIVFHREAVTTLCKFLQYILQKFQCRETKLANIGAAAISAPQTALSWLLSGGVNDPPIPPGATKFSYSTRLGEIKIRLCDTDVDFLEIKISILESDCLFKANERMVLRAYLSSISVDDLSDITLYPKILAVEEDKMFDFKYVRHSPKLYTQSDIESNKDDVKSDGSLRLHVGRLHVVLLSKFFTDLQHFMEPFVRPGTTAKAALAAERTVESRVAALKGWPTRLRLSLNLHAPTLLIPQKSDSPNLLVLNLGDLSVENFFKEVSSVYPEAVIGASGKDHGNQASPLSAKSPPIPPPVVDNILIRLEALQVARAVMTLAGSLQTQEPILEPASMRLDVKRAVAPVLMTSATSGPWSGHYNRESSSLLYDVHGCVEGININMGQRDLATILAVISDNPAEAMFSEMLPSSHPTSPLEGATPTGIGMGPPGSTSCEDPAVRRLQAFLCQSGAEQVHREAAIRLSFDGLRLNLFNDMDEVLSSPVRDMQHGLSRLELGEATVSMDTFSDHSLEIKLALQSCFLEDIRPSTSIAIRKIFQSHGNEMPMDPNGPISVSTPPIVDLTFRQTQTGDRCVDILVECTRINLSVPFLAALGRFLVDALPGERVVNGHQPYCTHCCYYCGVSGGCCQCEHGGMVNHGYVGDFTTQSKIPPVTAPSVVDGLKQHQPHHAPPLQRPPSSTDSTSGYFSSGASCADDQAGLSVSIQLRKPEIMIFSCPPPSVNTQGNAQQPKHALLVRTEFLVDYSRHPGRDSLVCSCAGLQILSRPQGPNKQPPCQVLHPCDIEFAKSYKSADDGMKVTASVSTIDIHLSTSSVHTLCEVVEEIKASFQPDEMDNHLKFVFQGSEAEDLWSPKKITSCLLPDTLESPMYTQPPYPSVRPSETFTIAIPKVRLSFELEDWETGERMPLLRIKSSIEGSVHDWSKLCHANVELQLQASYYNDKIKVWEPLIEPITEEENVYRPWEVIIKAFQAKAFRLSSRFDHQGYSDADGVSMFVNSQGYNKNKRRATQEMLHRASLDQTLEDSETSADEAESGEGTQSSGNGMMHFIKMRQDTEASSQHVLRNEHDLVSLAGYADDSDSETEEGGLEKLTSAMGHLFSGDSSEGDVSESEEESSGEEPGPSPNGSDETSDREETSHNLQELGISPGDATRIDRAVFIDKHHDSLDSGLEAESGRGGCGAGDMVATYVLVDSRDRFELSLTPAAVRVLTDLASAFSKTDGPFHFPIRPLTLIPAPLTLENEVGPGCVVNLVTRNQDGQDKIAMSVAYEKIDSIPSSPASSGMLIDGSPTESDVDFESFEGGFSSSGGVNNLPSPVMNPTEETVTKLYKKVTEERLVVEMEGFEKLQILLPQRAASKLHVLQPALNGTRYYVVASVELLHSRRRIMVRSALQIRNETSHALGLFYCKSALDAVEGAEQIGESINPFEDSLRFAVLGPQQTLSVPLFIAHHCSLLIQPAAYTDIYRPSETSLWWQDLAADLNTPKDICCQSKKENDSSIFSVRAVCEEGVPVSRPLPGSARLVPNYTIRLVPPLQIHNRLPYALEINVPSVDLKSRVESGEEVNVYSLSLLKTHTILIEMPSYLGIPWTGSFNLSPELEEKTVSMVTEYETEGGNKQLGLNLKVERSSGSCVILIYSPYWVINKTGLPLQMRGSMCDVVYDCGIGGPEEEPLLFRFRKRRRRRVRLRAYQSSWSSAFSLDASGGLAGGAGGGAGGLVVCKDRERGKRRYRILMKSTLSRSSPQLTRIISFLPNFLIVNETRKHLRFMEENERADLWIDLSPGQSIPFWPDTDSMRMHVKFRDSKLVSQHFPISQTHRTVLRMDKGGALVVDVKGGGDQPFTISLQNYCVGDAPVRVDNLCEDLFLKVHQEDLGQVALLSPYQSMLYTWDDPTKGRSLIWNVYNRKARGFNAEIWKDGFGQERVSFHTIRQQQPVGGMVPNATVTSKLSASFKRLSPKSPVQGGTKDENLVVLGSSSSGDDTESGEDSTKPQILKKTRKDKVTVYWVSYLDDHQRVYLFTQDERIAAQARSRIDAEKSHLEVFLSLNSIGVSLATESAGHVKEVAYASIVDSAPLWEVFVSHRWKLLPLELATWIEERWSTDSKRAQMRDYVNVDFEKMQMTKPFYGELRRRHYPGLWVQYRKSENQSYLHFKVHRFQVDNQLHDAVFPTVIHPTPIAQRIVQRFGSKPCIEVLLMKRHRPTENQDVYKYIKILVQSFSVQLDRGFLLTVSDIFSVWQPEEKASVRIRADIALVHSSLSSIAAKPTRSDPQVVIEYIHLSPLRIQFSFSPRGTVYLSDSSADVSKHSSLSSDLLNLFLNTLGVALTEVKGIKLKMAFFERRGLVCSYGRLKEEAMTHYTSQVLQQFHVIVLGLDVLGNPYGLLVSDFTQGLGDLFYEPYLGMMEGPEEFAEGICSGAQSLLGHIIGGTAGSTSLFAASFGNMLSGFSFDEDYKKKRKFGMQLNSDLPETILLASKTFVMGVALGLSGVFTKPILDREVTGAHQDGLEGFFKGVGKGLMGLITKPTGGVFDCISIACDGIKRAVEMGENVILRSRLPRFINPHFGVKPFSLHEATGFHLLNTLSKGHYADTDTYWAHAPLSSEGRSTVLVTLQHVFLLEKCRLWGSWEVDWVVRIDDIVAVPHLTGKKLIFKVRQDESLNFFSGDERFVESEDKAVLLWLQSKIEMAMIINMEDKPCPIQL
ncbi:vacuolar protein sorting-associated protein 13C-like isoform X1 [Ischnura elegans]|uniref:vacuolar protein sorting-associated protein 13C-like isoform X1 n=1 Tax=Ischnura elegans TaxID=197161 RepID=UPI001ED89C52|nr:vacuolar protein sorting-associated protein 13C-like isoform X1 [Ischnura elegans]